MDTIHVSLGALNSNILASKRCSHFNLVTHSMYHYLIINYASPAALADGIWSLYVSQLKRVVNMYNNSGGAFDPGSFPLG